MGEPKSPLFVLNRTARLGLFMVNAEFVKSLAEATAHQRKLIACVGEVYWAIEEDRLKRDPAEVHLMTENIRQAQCYQHAWRTWGGIPGA